MDSKDQLSRLEAKMDEIIKRLDHLEKQKQNVSIFAGQNIWVLVPVAAIIMWGLQRIFE
ncbi:hypothetical protein [Falsibacillus albus]|uniref:hypothetical protein n=1 Tax=Falsibacillus albus TaxID=2478915 RepID=UPI0013140C47|nr:hypothetical protein [Falsibacillus albus]